MRYKNTDYSVPVAYAHRDVVVKGYVDTVAIAAGADEIARHPRSYESADFVFDPLHHLALIEMKVGALDQAAPLQGWALPENFLTLRVERRPPKLDLAAYPYLPEAKVETTSAASYMSLLADADAGARP